MVDYHVTPIDPDRRGLWAERLHRETLPITDPRPRPGAAGGLVFDIATDRLSHLERARLAGILAEQNGGYWPALAAVNEAGVSIPALGLAVILAAQETAVTG